MCENKGIKKDHSADLHGTANNKGNKYGEKNRPNWQNFTAKCPKREGGVFPTLVFCPNCVVTFPGPDSQHCQFWWGHCRVLSLGLCCTFIPSWDRLVKEFPAHLCPFPHSWIREVNASLMLGKAAQEADEGRGKRGGRLRTLYRTPRKISANGIGDNQTTVEQNNTEAMRGWNVTHEWKAADVLPQGHKQNYNYRKQRHPIKQKSISYAAEKTTNKLTSIIICLYIKEIKKNDTGSSPGTKKWA